eukprot:CAMPEP_0201525966 /NCGR_PEP_ID=MMETSP0161_2-20130828/30199_1 /ASSEMBLY_ACC=CAM_ASM_000251 /TAXON_ID=180227 /ORGANISM="Neoparamoeba aestuarina, Strain SoJaBio B1-5/56/2" /LENGTH=98 /DNA_ID=CAMNT_0047926141 /DNA_START=103 /DNA_END=396 /DNA_ORIENTATION=+
MTDPQQDKDRDKEREKEKDKEREKEKGEDRIDIEEEYVLGCGCRLFKGKGEGGEEYLVHIMLLDSGEQNTKIYKYRKGRPLSAIINNPQIWKNLKNFF